MDKIVVLDFGSQYSHLICRRIREFSVYAELVPFDISLEELKKLNPKGIVFSGGPASVYNNDSPQPSSKIFEMGLPVLGICYGHQLIVNNFGGKVKRANKEYGSSTLKIDNGSDLLAGMGPSTRAWMSHGDAAESLPQGFEVIGHTESSFAAAIANRQKLIYGIQFHPVVHTENGIQVLKNFVLIICKAKQDWTLENFIEDTVSQISKIDGNVLCGISGGVDSTVAALLIQKAIGNRLKCVFVDNGLLRLKEEKEVEEMFEKNFGMNFTAINAKQRFLSRLKGVTDPEQKRKIVGEEFVEVFTEFAEKSGPFKWLAQVTLYPDVIESGVSKGPAAVIKTHHNVGGLPSWLDLQVLEPLRFLYKDEGRRVGKMLGVPDKLLYRHPFPGPGLAVRIMGEVTEEKLQICKQASKKLDHIIIPIEFALEEIGKAKIISDKLKASKDKITITKDDCLYDHETKLAKAVKLTEPSEYIEGSAIPYTVEKLYGSLSFGNYWKERRQNITLNGHHIRLAHTFVDFDRNGEPILEKEFEGFEALLTTISSIIKKYSAFW